jgi:hypothetical protein
MKTGKRFRIIQEDWQRGYSKAEGQEGKKAKIKQ